MSSAIQHAEVANISFNGDLVFGQMCTSHYEFNLISPRLDYTRIKNDDCPGIT